MDEQEVLQILRRVGAIITDSHIVYTSGKHGTAYIDKDMVYPHTRETSHFCRAIAERFADSGVEAVVGPEKGAIILSQWAAFHLSELTGREVLSFYAEKTEDGGFVIKRGGAQSIIPGQRVLVVEDVLTTGGSARKVVKTTRSLGGEIIGLGVLCNRGGIKPEDVGNVPELFALLNINLESWEETRCPLCAKGIPINTEVGKGREFLARQGK